MENENLFYKIRELLQEPDQIDKEWDPNKFWTLFEARKRRRQIWIKVAYSMAAMLVFVLGYVILPGKIAPRHIVNNVETRGTHQMLHVDTAQSTGNEGQDITSNRQPPKERYLAAKTGKKPSKNRRTISKINPKQEFTNAENLAVGKTIDTSTIRRSDTINVAAGVNAFLSIKENEEMPSLTQMREQARRERLLRNLSVKLEDRESYNSFWLTVNQHLLANKFNGDTELLHYGRQRPASGTTRN
jgi:hypothetical protein